MLKFFDLLFYHIYKFYADYKEKGAESTSAGIVGGLQTINVLTLLMLWSLFSKSKTVLSNIMIVIVLLLFFQVYTYIRYIYKDDNSSKIIESRWVSKSGLQKQRLRYYIAVYIISSVTIFFGLAIYLGRQKW